MTRKEALDAITGGVAVALISAIVTVIAVTYSIYQNIDDGVFRLLNDWVSYIDVVLILTLAFFLNRKSRFAAVTLVLYYVLNKVILFQAMDIQNIRPFTVILPLIFLYFFVKSAYGTFIFHRIEKQENPDYKKPSKKLLYIFSPILLIIAVILGIGVFGMFNGSLELLKSKEISNSQIAELKKAKIILPSDKIDYLYGYDLYLIDSGVVLTSNTLIIFYTENNTSNATRLHLSKIAEIRLKEQGDYINDSIYEFRIKGSDKWFSIYLSTRLDRDKRFVKKIQDYISKNQ
jgi:hypothetical protein